MPFVVTGSAESITPIERSAAAITEVITMAELFASTRSDDVDATVAVSTRIVDSLGAFTVIAMVGAAPTSRDGRVHEITWPDRRQVQPLPVALTNATLPAGKPLVTVTPDAVFGPRLLTSIEYCKSPLPSTGSGESVIAIERSAAAFTVVFAVAALFARLASGVADATCTVLDTAPPLAGAITTSVITEAAAMASAGFKHVTSWSTAEHDQPVPDAVTNATPPGRLSSTVRPVAPPGPVSVTVIA